MCLILRGLNQSLNPKITKVSSKTLLHKGNVARLDCFVQYLGDYTVSWIKIADSNGQKDFPNVLTSGGTRVTQDTRITIRSETNQQYTLEVRDINDEDSGVYQCQISTDPLIYKDVELTVLYPPKIVYTPSDIYSQEGSTVKLSCNATGSPKPKIYWMRLDNDILPMGGLKYLGYEMILNNMQRSDRGAYICVAESPIGTHRRVVSVFMEFAPKIITEKRNLLVAQDLNSKAELECVVEGTPKANVHWTYQGMEIHGDYYKTALLEEGYDTVISDLTIKNVKKGDLGDYTCVAVNNFGRDEKTFRLFDAVKGNSGITNHESLNYQYVFILSIFIIYQTLLYSNF
ncbi:unnamed protein product [Gordionus sp. m RMFG-2023]